MTHDEEIKRQNEKIEFLARTNMLYSDWEHRNNQVTSDLIRKGIEEHKINIELRAEIERLKDAVLAEREACARIADYKLDNKGLTAPDSPKEWWNHACQNIRDAIRARGKS